MVIWGKSLREAEAHHYGCLYENLTNFLEFGISPCWIIVRRPSYNRYGSKRQDILDFIDAVQCSVIYRWLYWFPHFLADWTPGQTYLCTFFFAENRCRSRQSYSSYLMSDNKAYTLDRKLKIFVSTLKYDTLAFLSTRCKFWKFISELKYILYKKKSTLIEKLCTII